MAQPGTTSKIALLITGTWSLLLIAILIGGHLAMVMVAYCKVSDKNLEVMFTNMTSMPMWMLWLSILGAIIMDLWIYYYSRKDRKAALKR